MVRKNLLITFGIFAGFIIFGLIGVFSAKYGNIAQNATDKQTILDVMQASLYFGLTGGCIVTTGVEHIISLVKKDYEIEKAKMSGIELNELKDLLDLLY
ncbi:MAG: hypothetical protein IKS48_02715 [Eubacterium sp.]|nr:hypothetical protein [Eubacterium sp.]